MVTIRYDTRCYFNVRSKADISQLKLSILLTLSWTGCHATTHFCHDLVNKLKNSSKLMVLLFLTTWWYKFSHPINFLSRHWRCSTALNVDIVMVADFRSSLCAHQEVSQYMGWQWRNFDSYLCRLVFAAILWVKLSEMFATEISLKCVLLESYWPYRHFINWRIEFYLNNTINLRPLTPHIMPSYTHEMAIVSWP